MNLKQLRQFAGDDVAQDAMDDLALELQEARNALATREQVIKDQQALIESLSPVAPSGFLEGATGEKISGFICFLILINYEKQK